jgi:hypothetical protein
LEENSIFVTFELKSDQATQASGARNITQIIDALAEKFMRPMRRAPSAQKNGVLPELDDVLKASEGFVMLYLVGFCWR